MNILKREPALISGVVAAVIALAVAFGFDLSGEKIGAIMAVVAAVLAIVTRASVTPNVSVAALEVSGMTVAGAASPIPDGTPVLLKAGPARPISPYVSGS